MQMHPAEPGESIAHCVNSLAAGYIGLDFHEDVGNLLLAEPQDLPEGQRDYLAFAREMREEDLVLVIAHHFPFALVRVIGAYNYICTPVPEIGVWFRHFRKVGDIRYYADHFTNVRKWDQIRMTDTISPLRDTATLSYKLIESWK
jgi:hypothetical protein